MFKTKSGRPITYYGAEKSEKIKAIKKDGMEIKTLDDLFQIFLQAWCRETAFPSCQKEYIYDNDPTYGQCAITAMIVNDLFGGSIHKIRVSGGGTHYFNKIEGQYFDLTSDQFELYDIPVNYVNNEEVPREYCGKNPDTYKRFNILLQRIEQLSKNL